MVWPKTCPVRCTNGTSFTTVGLIEFDYISPKTLEVFGVWPEELSRMTDFIHPEELKGFLQNLGHATHRHLPWSYEGRTIMPGQPVRWLRGSFIVTGTGPDWVKYSGILPDLTPVKLAVGLARIHTYGLVLMDVRMPVLNGYQATAQLRQDLGLAPLIVALTVNVIGGERIKCVAAGMNDYLTKPFGEVPPLKMGCK